MGVHITPVYDEANGVPFVYYEVYSDFSGETTTTNCLFRAEEIADELIAESLDQTTN